MKTNTIVQPTYTTTQPSTGNKVKFRPFTVKEEKALLLALQEDDIVTVSDNIKNIVSACTSIDPDQVPYYDIEYIFLQIRSKSVGEIIELIGSCECSEKAKTDFEIDIRDTKINPEPYGNLVLKIEGTPYTIELRHPSLSDFAKFMGVNIDTSTEVVANSIVSIYTDSEVMDWNINQKNEFLDSMTPKQQKEISKFLQNMPMVELPINYTCKTCGKKHTDKMSGFQNFFV